MKNAYSVFLFLFLLQLPPRLYALESSCKQWFQEAGIPQLEAKAMIVKMYDLMRSEDEHYKCLIHYYRQHHLTSPEHKQLFYNFMGQCKSIKGEYDSAKAYILLAIGQDSLMDNPETLPADLATLGNIELYQRRFQPALAYFEQALDAVDWSARPYVIANIFSSMGVCYLELEMPGNAMAHFSHALEYGVKDTTFNAKGRRLIVRHNIGVVHNTREQYGRALAALEPLLDSLDEVDFPYLERLLHSSIGYSYLQTGQLKLAEQHLKQLIGEGLHFDSNQEELYYYLLELYAEQAAYEKMGPILDAISEHYETIQSAPPYDHYLWSGRYAGLQGASVKEVAGIYKTGLSRLPKDSLPANRARFYRALAEVYARDGQFEDAYKYQARLSDALEAEQLADQMRAAEDIAVAYEVKEYRNQAKQARAREQLSRVRAEMAERKNQYTSWIAGLSALTVLLLGFSYWQYRRRSRSQQEAAQERNRRLAQEKTHIRQQLEYQKTAVLDKSLWAAGLKPKVSEAIDKYHKRPDYLERKIHQIFAEEDILPQFQKEFELFYPDFSRALLREMPNMTDKQLRYAMLIALGLNNKEIAEILFVSVKAVEMARYRLREALGIGREEQLEIVLRNYLLQPSSAQSPPAALAGS